MPLALKKPSFPQNDHLAAYAASHDVGILRLETGIHQHAAIRLYEREGFTRIPPFGPYRDAPRASPAPRLAPMNAAVPR